LSMNIARLWRALVSAFVAACLDSAMPSRGCSLKSRDRRQGSISHFRAAESNQMRPRNWWSTPVCRMQTPPEPLDRIHHLKKVGIGDRLDDTHLEVPSS